jgi:hypothetical protein
MPPPTLARLPGGRTIELAEAAAEICRRYAAEFPDEAPRYGDAWMPWCRHDNQHILNWAASDLAGLDDLDRRLDWLWDVLAARGFPVERVPRNLELAAAVMRERGETDIAGRLAEARHGLVSRRRPGAQ